MHMDTLKIKRSIESCKNLEQLKSADKMIELFFIKWKRKDSNSEMVHRTLKRLSFDKESTLKNLS